ncbi:hypothetical protein NBRC116602_13790 [Hyphomicrobiales bacterium 4NK60-0047b]
MSFLSLLQRVDVAAFILTKIGVAKYFLRLAVISLLGFALAGCSLGSVPSFGDLGGSVFGSSEEKKKVSTSEKVLSEDRLLAEAKQEVTALDQGVKQASLCTKFKIWDAERFLTVYDVGRYGDGLAVRYRGELTKAARECVLQPGTAHVKVGFAGRVLLGPKGQAGQVQLPLHIYLTDKKGKILKNTKISVPVSIEQGKPIGYFSMIKKIDIPLTEGRSGKDFRLFVGFDKIEKS